MNGLSFGLDDNQPAIAASNVQKAPVRADKHRQHREVVADLKPAEAKHGWEHAQNNITFLRPVNQFVHVIAVFDDLRGDDVAAVFRENALVRCAFLAICQFAQIRQKLAINGE